MSEIPVNPTAKELRDMSWQVLNSGAQFSTTSVDLALDGLWLCGHLKTDPAWAQVDPKTQVFIDDCFRKYEAFVKRWCPEQHETREAVLSRCQEIRGFEQEGAAS